ncbi:MAG: zinc-ribbon domain-containing protein [Oscillospiraceae bacterium]|nr:zinc-ribbon domain-containing protein [Oscillospiraceae bacterium]
MICEKCGGELRDTAKFCPFCGTKLDFSETENTQEAPSPESENTEKSAPPEASEEAAAPETESVQEQPSPDSETSEDTVPPEKSEEVPEISLADKFDEKDGLFVVRESTENTAVLTEMPPQKRKFPLIPVVSCIAAAGLLAFLIPVVIVPAVNYANAEKLYRNGLYAEAKAAFSALGEYRESEGYIPRCDYGIAAEMMESGDLDGAVKAFSALEGYADSAELAEKCTLEAAAAHISEGRLSEAVEIYEINGKTELAKEAVQSEAALLAESGNYSGAAEIAEKYAAYFDKDADLEYTYQGALYADENGDYKTAADSFYRLGSYKNSAALALESTYSFYSSEYARKGASEETVRGFYFLGDFKNSAEMFISAAYDYGVKCLENGRFSDAAAMFKNAAVYKDAPEMLHKARYELGKSLMDTSPESARSVFALLSTYGDSAKQKKAAAELIPDSGHEGWYADGFTSSGDYYTAVFRKNDTLLVTCTAGTDSISAPVTLVLTFEDSAGLTVSADCENVRNSSSFSGSFSLDSAAPGSASVTVSRKDNGAVLRVFGITIAE